jgi:hypothetical protein
VIGTPVLCSASRSVSISSWLRRPAWTTCASIVLDGLTAREMMSGADKVILPVWYEVDHDHVRAREHGKEVTASLLDT